MLMMEPGTDRHDVSGDCTTGEEHHLHQSEKKLPQEEPVRIGSQRPELEHYNADMATSNTLLLIFSLVLCGALFSSPDVRVI